MLMVNQWYYVDQLDCTKDDPTLYNYNQSQVMEQNNSGLCFKTGKHVLEFLTLGLHKEWLNFFGLVFISAIFRLSAYLTLHYVAKKR